MKITSYFLLSALLTAVLACGPALASNDYPDQTDDGLERIKSKKADALFWKEGASLAEYKRVRIDNDIEVSFKKNWLRDQNRSRTRLNDKVSTDDMENIRTALAALFVEQFSKELEKGGYAVVDENGTDVLLLQPAIVDLDVTSPDVSSSQAGMSRTYSTSAGEMTLNMEFRDSATNALIGRVIDRRKDYASGTIQYSSSISNQAEARRMLSSWARALVKALDNAHDDA